MNWEALATNTAIKVPENPNPNPNLNLNPNPNLNLDAGGLVLALGVMSAVAAWGEYMGGWF
ncbi:MAG: hypothetical protein ACYCOU_12160 [Sulfobacillus sp.]